MAGLAPWTWCGPVARGSLREDGMGKPGISSGEGPDGITNALELGVCCACQGAAPGPAGAANVGSVWVAVAHGSRAIVWRPSGPECVFSVPVPMPADPSELSCNVRSHEC